ncbi:hypothetical protein B4U80_13850, partial [Leptotrombidium deliense]
IIMSSKNKPKTTRYAKKVSAFGEKILAAIRDLNENSGSKETTIFDYVRTHFKNFMKDSVLLSNVKSTLKSMVKNGHVTLHNDYISKSRSEETAKLKGYNFNEAHPFHSRLRRTYENYFRNKTCMFRKIHGSFPRMEYNESRLRVIIMTPMFVQYLIENLSKNLNNVKQIVKLFNIIFEFSTTEEKQMVAFIINKDAVLVIAAFNYFDDTEYTKMKIIRLFECFKKILTHFEVKSNLYAIIFYLLNPNDQIIERFVSFQYFNEVCQCAGKRSRIEILNELRSFFIPIGTEFVLNNIDQIITPFGIKFLSYLINNTRDTEVHDLMRILVQIVIKRANINSLNDGDVNSEQLRESLLKSIYHLLIFDKFLYLHVYPYDKNVLFFACVFTETAGDHFLESFTKSKFGATVTEHLMNTGIPMVAKKIRNFVEKRN